jgi:hypothetical protein
VVAVAVSFGSCGSPSTTPGWPSDLSATGKSRLADYCAKRQACQVETGVTVGACPTSMCLGSEAAEGPLLEYFDCQIAKQCSSFFNDDDCAASAGTPDAEQTQFLSRCTARNTECSGDFASICQIGAMPLLLKKYMHAFDACLGKACGEIDACLSAASPTDCW